MPSPDSHPSLELVSSRGAATGASASDAALVAGLADRQDWAAAALWARFGTLVYRIGERALGSPHEAEDLTQDVFMCLFDRIANLRDPGALRSFVISVTIRTLKWKLRRRRVRRWVGLTETGVVPDLPVRGVDVDQALQRFYRLLDKLRASDRMVFVLRRVDGMQLADVAEATGHSVATVKRRLQRADASLARMMEGEPVLVTFLRGEGGER
jgi:RNA polymerase sigma-70 factor (ECF subfamily)